MAKKPKVQEENIQKVSDSYIINVFQEEISIAEKLEFIANADQEELVNIIDQMDWDGSNRRGALSLKSKIKKAVWRVLPAGDSAREKQEAELVREMWDKFGNKFLDFFMRGVLYGFNVCVPSFQSINGRWEWKKINDLGAKYFVFTPDWKLKNKIDLKFGKNKTISRNAVLPEDVFTVYTYEEENGNRYGKSLRLRNYYLWLFYRECLQIWSLFNKKATIPSFIATSDANTSTDNKNTALEIATTMKRIKNGVGGVLYNIKSIEKLDANPQGYKSMMEFKKDLKDEMVQNYTGSTLGTETNSTGSSYNIGELHKQTSEDFALEIAQDFLSVINAEIKKLVDLNRPEGLNLPYPEIDVYYKESADIETVLKAGAQGAPLKRDVLIDEYKLPLADAQDEKEGNLIYLVPNQPAATTEIKAFDANQIMANFLNESKKKSLM